MARRRLEEAIQAGQCIAKGKQYPDRFTQVCVDYDITLEKECGGVYSLQYSFDGKFLAIGCGNGVIRLYDTQTGRKLPDIRNARYGGYPIMVLRFHPKNPAIIFAGTSEGQVLSCDISDFLGDNMSQEQVQSDKDERWSEIIVEKKGTAKNEINCMDFDYPATNYATAGKDLNIRIYDSGTNQIVREYTGYDNTKNPTDLQFSGCAARVFALRFHPEYDDIFITGGWDRQLKIWDARSNDGVKRTIHGPHLCGDALDLKGFKILTGSYIGTDDALQIWNYSTDYSSHGAKPQCVNFPSKGKGAHLYAAQFCDNNIVLAGGSGTNSAMAINSETNEGEGAHVYAAQFCDNNKALPGGSGTNSAIAIKILSEIKFDHPVHAIDTTMGGRLFAVGDGERSLKMCSLR